MTLNEIIKTFTDFRAQFPHLADCDVVEEGCEELFTKVELIPAGPSAFTEEDAIGIYGSIDTPNYTVLEFEMGG